MGIPHPGELRHKIQIGQTLSVTNENGYPAESDSILYHVWAGIEDDSSRWYRAADVNNAKRGLSFVVRWIAGVQPGMWVLWNGDKQWITKIGEYDFKRRYMKLTTTAVKGVR